MTTNPGFRNYAGRADVDDALEAELRASGIEVNRVPELFRKSEVRTIIMGSLHGWTFKRAWRYWVCEGPGIDVVTAERLHATHGEEVRVDGHPQCPSPREWLKGLACGLYHVDTQIGLNALADTIRGRVGEIVNNVHARRAEFERWALINQLDITVGARDPLDQDVEYESVATRFAWRGWEGRGEHEVAIATTQRQWTGVGHLEETGYIPEGSAAEREK
jgi:hypothetical protein